MLWQRHQKRPIWEETDHLIDQWLEERQELLILYYSVSKLKPFEEDCEDTEQALQNFCQILVDYVSVGHFEIFEKLAKASAHVEHKNLGLDRNLLVEILRTTMKALDFNDKYADNHSKAELQMDLSLLGEQLSFRLDLEDKLITTYLRATTQLKEKI